ncbi:MAG TPA: right-handed parallel beta-helix repeat-containing protein [Sedimentisphaerales bacterium]|nr:right-handed parallel beta-helix repeat-containing protein [Sedimentisphaerales bacterium]
MKRFALVVTLLLCGSQARARILTVGPAGYGTIQSAINDANDGDTVVVAAGAYQENINFLGKAITVRSTDPNDPNVVSETIIDGSNPPDPNCASVVTFNGGEGSNSVLAGFTITGGTGSWLLVSWEYKGLRWNRCGGGAVCYNMSQPTITKNVFVGNLAGVGGGVYIYGDPVNPNDPSNPPFHLSPLITDNTFIENSAVMEHGFEPPDANYPTLDHGDGGAIVAFQGCDPVITGNLIRNNQAEFYGGGMHLRQWSHGLIENNQIMANDASLGGGIHVTYDSSPTIRNNLIERNTAGTFGGGGLYVYARSNPTIEQNLVAHNDCFNGAGMAIYASSAPLIRNNFIVNNKNGAGIRVRGSAKPVIIHNTIADNSALVYSGGIDCTGNVTPTIENNIISGSGEGYGIYADETSFPVVRYNNVWDNGAGGYGPNLPDQTGINGNISAPPGFANPDANDYHLSLTSRCINAGDPNFTHQGLIDWDGESRKMGQFVDIGADEAWPVWNLSADKYYLAIQQAIDDANDGDTIVVTQGRYYEKISYHTKNLVLRSADPNDWAVVEKTIIDANQTGTVVAIAQGQDANCVFAGFTVTGGDATNGHGGGIYCYAGPRIERNIITDNYSFYKGGGVYFWSSDATALLNDNIITRNTADFGAGILADTASQPAITNNIISENHAEILHGGLGCSYNLQTVLIADNQFFANTAQFGGGISCASSSPLICGNLICGNVASVHGGGIKLNFSSPQIINNSIVDCCAPAGAGIYCMLDSDPNIANNIVAFGRQGEGIYCYHDANRPSEPNLAHNDVYGNAGGNYGGSLTDQTGVRGNISVDPNFVRLGSWDDANTPGDANDDFFVPGNYHLLPGSPCIDAGDNNSVPPSLPVDMDGEERVFEDAVDIGADEFVTNPFDLNTDGIVDYLELKTITDFWLQSGSGLPGDFYPDDFIDFADFSLLAAQWLWTGGWYE